MEPRASTRAAAAPVESSARGARRLVGLAALAAAAGGAACAKGGWDRATASPSAYDYDGYGDYGDSGGVGYRDEAGFGVEAEQAMLADEGETTGSRIYAKREVSRSEGSANRGAMRKHKAADAPSTAGGGAPPAPLPVDARPAPEPSAEPRAEAGPSPEPEPQPDTPTHGRLVIYTAQLVISVFSLPEAMKVAEALPERLGGYVHARREGYLELKIPAARLGEAMDLLAGLGRVESRSLQADDVTAEFVDLESRIRVLRATQQHLIALLAKATTVDETLKVRAALDRVTIELELALGRMRYLSNLISFSTLTVILQERGPMQGARTSNDPFPWVDSLGVEAVEFVK